MSLKTFMSDAAPMEATENIATLLNGSRTGPIKSEVVYQL